MRFLRSLFVYFVNNEKLINKLADSKPFRIAARYVVSLLARTDTLNSFHRLTSNPREFVKQLKDIAQSFKDEVKQVKDDIMRKNQK